MPRRFAGKTEQRTDRRTTSTQKEAELYSDIRVKHCTPKRQETGDGPTDRQTKDDDNEKEKRERGREDRQNRPTGREERERYW